MDSRISQFDYIRVISLFGILICHSLFETYDYGWLGRYFGLTFNFLFLILSAFLLGIAWEKKERKVYGSRFLIRRTAKLSKTYYPYLVILFFFLYVSQDYFSPINVLTHVAYLSWFDKIEGFGHLWFMTMIVICYVGCVFVSKYLRYIWNNLLTYCGLVGGGICTGLIIDKFGLPGYLFPYLVGYLIAFANADKILSILNRMPLLLNVLQFAAINTAIICAFHIGIFEAHRFCSYLLGMISAMSICSFLWCVCRSFPSSKLIVWLSGISFEVYLVHEFFLGRYSVYSFTPNSIIGFSVLCLLSVLAAMILGRFSTIISKILKSIRSFLFKCRFI